MCEDPGWVASLRLLSVSRSGAVGSSIGSNRRRTLDGQQRQSADVLRLDRSVVADFGTRLEQVGRAPRDRSGYQCISNLGRRARGDDVDRCDRCFASVGHTVLLVGSVVDGRGCDRDGQHGYADNECDQT